MTRKQFYSSDTWRNFVNGLKQERTEADGFIRCAHCGRPIVKKYDAIGHHKTELNDINVNDVNVALNPDNVELIHFKCHNAIHQRYGYTAKVYIVYGSPRSGKTTFVNENANDDDLIVDLDRLWNAICNSYKPNRLKPNLFGLRDTLIDQIRTRTGTWRNAWIIGGYPLRSDRDRLCNLLNAETVFIDTSEEECLARCESEDYRGYVREWFRSYTA